MSNPEPAKPPLTGLQTMSATCMSGNTSATVTLTYDADTGAPVSLVVDSPKTLTLLIGGASIDIAPGTYDYTAMLPMMAQIGISDLAHFTYATWTL